MTTLYRSGVVAKRLAVLAICAAMAGCGDEDPPATESVSSGGAIEDAINTACDEGQIVDIAMATRKSGYGSRTDYWLVLCRLPGREPWVVRVEVE